MKIWQAIYETKVREVMAAKTEHSEALLRELCEDLAPARGFARAIRGGRSPKVARLPRPDIQVIAEVKKASPSVGLIRPDFDALAIARSYEAGGAAAISCLTDREYFQGSLDYLRQIHAAVNIPLLRKDFLIDPFQVWEAREAGADAVLLIAGFVDWTTLQTLRDAARQAGLDVLVEIHNEAELGPALELDPDVLGINNRNLRSDGFVTDLATSDALAGKVPPCIPFISESGIRGQSDIDRLAKLGIDGVLVGEHLLREPDPGAAIHNKLGLGRMVTF